MQDQQTRHRINRATKVLRQTAGRFFYCEFVKKNGQVRKLIGRIGVRKHRTGEGLPYDPADYHLHVVWDLQNRGYRMVDLSTLFRVRCGDINWEDFS